MINNFFISFYGDAMEPSQLYFPDVGSPVAEQLIYFHDNVMLIIILVLCFVA